MFKLTQCYCIYYTNIFLAELMNFFTHQNLLNIFLFNCWMIETKNMGFFLKEYFGIFQEEEKPQTNNVNDSVEDESQDQVSQLKAELEEMQERVDALEEENKALSDQVVSLTVIAFVLYILIDALCCKDSPPPKKKIVCQFSVTKCSNTAALID